MIDFTKGRELTQALDPPMQRNVVLYQGRLTWKHWLEAYLHELAHAALLWRHLPASIHSPGSAFNTEVLRACDCLTLRTQNEHELKVTAITLYLDNKYGWKLFRGQILNNNAQNFLRLDRRYGVTSRTLPATEFKRRLESCVVGQFADRTETFIRDAIGAVE